MLKDYRKYLLLLLFLIPFTGKAQNRDIAAYDSITYQQYIVGAWDELIVTAHKAISEDIDFKWLRQRLGYALFIKKQYYQSYDAYEKAYKMDPTDPISILYLYYNSIYTGNYNRARYLAAKLPDETKSYFKQNPLRVIDAVDFEFSYKIPEYATRDNATFKRLGLNTQVGYRLNIYQTISEFRQTTDYFVESKQNDYFAKINWRPLLNSSLYLGYHYTGTQIIMDPDTSYYPGHLISFGATQQISRFDFTVSGSRYNSELLNSFQGGIHAGIGFAGSNNIYLKSSLYRLWQYWYGLDLQTKRYVFTQSAGIMLFNRIWTEASVALGNLDHFSDLGGLYFYNALDPSTLRGGLSLFGYLTPRLTLYTNYTIDRKYFTFFDATEIYFQHSITGGIIWKL